MANQMDDWVPEDQPNCCDAFVRTIRWILLLSTPVAPGSAATLTPECAETAEKARALIISGHPASSQPAIDSS